VGCPKCSQVLCVPTPKTKPKTSKTNADNDNAAFDSEASPHTPFKFVTRGSDDELDMTPMVDVTFLLLIFFMITAAFALQKSIEVPPTEDQQAAQTQTVEDFEEDSIIIRVDSDNTYWIQSPAWTTEKEAMSKQDMLVKLREARKSGAGDDAGPTKLLVLASGDAVHERVVAALDAGSAVGMEEVRLATVDDDF